MSSSIPEPVRLEAFGTLALVAVTDPERIDAAVEAVCAVVEEFDLACSRFRSDSELVALNAAGGSAVRVGPVLLEAVVAALRAARLTGGDVDPTIGQALIALGYDRDFEEVSDRVWPARPLATVPGWRTVSVDVEASTIRLARGVTLDLGATAKALAADHAAAAALDATGGCGVLVSFGGDLRIAGPAPADGWPVRVTDDHRAGVTAPGQWIWLRSGGLATSSVSVRRWRTSSGEAHHVVDPSTGGSVDSVWRTVSVSAASCLDANIASTAAIISGERAPGWLSELRLPGRLVSVDGTVCHVAGWPSAGDDLSAVALPDARVETTSADPESVLRAEGASA